tara:strand:+ start:8292 stop:8927 length:636 start_codon:yes stop_codon:yes gene_type:complete
MVKLLELFSGTGSVGKVAKSLGYEVVSLDLQGADINIDIMDWDYKAAYKPGDFDYVWSSPPCETFSLCRRCWINRKLKHFGDVVVTASMLDEDMEKVGLPILRKTEEIIDYFKPMHYFIENPESGKMKDYIDKPRYVIDYCMYSDYGYRKRTCIWTNKTGFNPLKCNKKCGNMIGNKHINNLGNGNKSRDEINRKHKYRIPEKLLLDLLKI